jgi:hypothetical protein
MDITFKMGPPSPEFHLYFACICLGMLGVSVGLGLPPVYFGMWGNDGERSVGYGQKPSYNNPKQLI